MLHELEHPPLAIKNIQKRCQCLLLALSGHPDRTTECPLLGGKADIAIFRAFERSSAVVLYPASGTDASGRAKEELRSPRKLPSLLLSPFRPLSQRLLRSFEPLSFDRCVAQIRKSTRRKLTSGNHIRPSAFKTWLPWPRTPHPPHPYRSRGSHQFLVGYWA
jgi:hypothetical protein